MRKPTLPKPTNAFEIPLHVALTHRFWPPHHGWLTRAYRDMDEFLTAGEAYAAGSGLDLEIVNPSPRLGGRGRPRATQRELAACLVFGGGVRTVALTRFSAWVRYAWSPKNTCVRLLSSGRWAHREEELRSEVRSLLRGVRQSKLKPQTWWLAVDAPAIAARAVLALARRIGNDEADRLAAAAFARYPDAPRVQLPAEDEYEHTLQPRLVGGKAQQDALLTEIACFNRHGLPGVRQYRIEDLRHFRSARDPEPVSPAAIPPYLLQLGWDPTP